jgi:hypothetical protein
MFVLPIRADDLISRRGQLALSFNCLREAVIEAVSQMSLFEILVCINGESALGFNPAYIARALEVLAPLSARITISAKADKISVVNQGLSIARAAEFDLLFVVDDDIEFTSTTVAMMISLHKQLNGKGIGCMKAPLVHNGSTEFQRVYSRSYEVSFDIELFPKRPTGSIYCVDPKLISEFPAGSNDGDYLALCNVPLSGIAVRSEFPPTIEQEIRRRVRLRRASLRTGYTRPTDNIHLLNEILGTTTKPRAAIESKPFLESMKVYETVFSTVESFTK